MRAFVYTRQSLDRTGAGAAVERQRQDCQKLCAERGWTIVREFTDNDVSASSTKPRRAYTAMLAAVENGEAEVVVAWHVDRLTRKITDLEHLIELAQATGLRIATVTGDLDLSTDAGRLVGRILASVARGEVERKGARQRRAQQQSADLGKPPGGRRAFGYDRTGAEVIEAEAEWVRKGYAALLTGTSLKGIAREWNEAGTTTTMGGEWRHDNVRTVLKNPRYAGLRSYKGEVVGDGTWEPIVDRDTYDAALALLSMPQRRTTATTARKYLLPGLALCWKCGSDVETGHTRHGKRVYNCRANKCTSRKAEPVDDLVEGVMIARLSRPDARELLTEQTPDLADHKARAQAIRERLDDLAVGLEEGLLTLPAVRKSSERLRAELRAVEAKMHATVHADVLGPLVTAEDVEQAWRVADLAVRRQAVDALMTVTLLQPERGRKDFDPESVRIDWKG